MRTDKELEDHCHQATKHMPRSQVEYLAGLRSVYELGLADAADRIVLELLPDVGSNALHAVKLVGTALESAHRLAERGLATMIKANRFNDYFARTPAGRAALDR